MAIQQDTIIAPATAPGESAIAVVRMTGIRAIGIADEMFRGKLLAKCASHTAHFGTMQDDEGGIIDEVVCTVFKAPNTYTGEDIVEISCHGSDYIVQRIIERGIALGARMATAGEFTMRAFLNGKMDLSQAEAVSDLIAAESRASHLQAMHQLRGGFATKIGELRTSLMHFASLLELELDFGEEDVEFADRTELLQLLEEIKTGVHHLKQSFHLGNVIKKGVATAIVGRPNAGKSTLLNRLLNEDRAIVSDIAGTTRDTIEERLTIDELVFRIIDTAGLRRTQDEIESIGVQKARSAIQKAQLVLYLFDVVSATPEQLKSDLEELTLKDQKLIILANKIDEFEGDLELFEAVTEPLDEVEFMGISAKKDLQVDTLKYVMYHTIVGDKDNINASMVTNMRHFEALERSYGDLERAEEGIHAGLSMDFVAMDIRQAIHHLGYISGEISTEDLLGNIFSKFCIGK